jgi:hypothetical protein
MSDEFIVNKPETLPDADEERLNALENKIEHTLTSALDAFEEIKRDRLYRGRYASFEEYVRERWGQSDRHLRRFLSFFKVKTLLEDVGVSTDGLTERAARELSTGTTPEEQKEIVKDITDQGKKITTNNVAKEKAKRGKGKKSRPVQKTEPDQPSRAKSEDPLADKPAGYDQPCKSADQPPTPAPTQPVTDQKTEDPASAQPVRQDQVTEEVDKTAKQVQPVQKTEPNQPKSLVKILPWPDDYTPMLPELIETYFTDFVIAFRETFPGYSWSVFAKAVSYAFRRIVNDKAEAVKKEKAAAEAMHKLGLQKRVDKMIKDNNQKVDQPSIGGRPLSRKERQAKCSQRPPSIKSMIEQLPVTVTGEDGKVMKVELDLGALQLGSQSGDMSPFVFAHSSLATPPEC